MLHNANFIQFEVMFFNLRKYPFNIFGVKIHFFMEKIIEIKLLSLFLFNVLTEKTDDPV